MADQIAARDPNRTTALLVHDSTGAETRQVRASVANPNALPVEVVAGGTGIGSSQVQGPAASNAPAVGNPVLVGGKYNATPQTFDDGDVANFQADANGYTKVREQYAPVSEDNVAGVTKVEQRFASFRVTADGLVKSGDGFVHTVNINPTTALPTAGLLTIYDSLTETGTILHSEWVFAAGIGHTIILDKTFSTGLYIGYDATLANVSVDGSYR